MVVEGAIPATWAAYTMNVPAEAARAPSGDTHTPTGMVECRMSLVIWRIEIICPPGVSSLMSTIAASRRRAWSIPRLM